MNEWMVAGGGMTAVVAGAGLMLKFIMGRLEKVSDDYRQLAENHIAHSTEAQVKLIVAIEQLTSVIRRRIRPEED